MARNKFRHLKYFKDMKLSRHVAAFVICSFALSYLTVATPVQSASFEVHDASKDLSLVAPQTLNSSIRHEVAQRVNISNSNTEVGPLPTGLSIGLRYWTVTWPISATLSLTINIGAWVLVPEKILHTLEVAKIAAGKKPAVALLERGFTVKTGSRFNKMIFEISPGYIYKHLTWADVGEVLGENGLPKFFEVKQEWHSAYFDVIDSRRGMLGYGAIRKWYMLDPVVARNSTRLGSVE